MSIEDPTLTTLASYDMSAGEAFIGLIVLAATVLLEIVNGIIPKVRNNFSLIFPVFSKPQLLENTPQFSTKQCGK